MGLTSLSFGPQTGFDGVMNALSSRATVDPVWDIVIPVGWTICGALALARILQPVLWSDEPYSPSFVARSALIAAGAIGLGATTFWLVSGRWGQVPAALCDTVIALGAALAVRDAYGSTERKT